MTPQTIDTTDDELCPGCDQTDGAYRMISTPNTDTWACRHCSTHWVITVAADTHPGD
jgi:ribosomal protein L37AE/L43A